MKLKAIKNAVTSKVGRQFLIAQKHSPGLMFAAGVVGVVGTVVLASRATLKVNDLLDDFHSDLDNVKTLESPRYSDKDRQRDKVVLYTKLVVNLGKLYGPALLVGMASVAALTGSHVVLNRRIAGVTAAYAALEKGFDAYRKRVVEELGIEKDREFRYGYEDRTIVEETEQGPIIKQVHQIGKDGASIYARFFDEGSANYQKSPGYNQIFLRAQQNYANDLLKARGHVFLNEVYDMLGLERSKEGAVVGWVLLTGCEIDTELDGDNYIDFGIFEHSIYDAMRFVNGEEKSILLDFNVDGVIYDKI
jgi:hypothetical protein